MSRHFGGRLLVLLAFLLLLHEQTSFGHSNQILGEIEPREASGQRSQPAKESSQPSIDGSRPAPAE